VGLQRGAAARAGRTHLGEMAELPEQRGLHSDVRGGDAPEQAEHRLEDGHPQPGVQVHDLLQGARGRGRDAIVWVHEGTHEEASTREAVDNEVAGDAARVEEGKHTHGVAVEPAPLTLAVAARGVGVLELRLVLCPRQGRLVAQQRPAGREPRVRGPKEHRVQGQGARLLLVVGVVPAAHVRQVEHVVVLIPLLGFGFGFGFGSGSGSGSGLGVGLGLGFGSGFGLRTSSGMAPWYMVRRSRSGLAPAPVAARAVGERGEVGVNWPKSAVKAASHLVEVGARVRGMGLGLGLGLGLGVGVGGWGWGLGLGGWGWGWG
jgi:hypothetical protein